MNLLEEAKEKNDLITLKVGWMNQILTKIATGGIWICGDMDQVKYRNHAEVDNI